MIAVIALLVASVGGSSQALEERLARELRELRIQDQRAAFARNFCDTYRRRVSARNAPPCESWLHLGDTVSTNARTVDAPATTAKIVIVPGLFGDCVSQWVAPFADARVALEKAGYATSLMLVSGRGGIANNAEQIAESLRTDPGNYQRTIIIGYSKGALDALEALVADRALQTRVDALISLGGPVGGSPTAAAIDSDLVSIVDRVPLPGCERGEGRAIADLDPEVRRGWLNDQDWEQLDVHLYAVAAYADIDRVSWIMRSGARRLSQHGPNDGQVVLWDALLPYSQLLALVNADHWALALPFETRARWLSRTAVNRNRFPRESLLVALIDFVLTDLERP